MIATPAATAVPSRTTTRCRTRGCAWRGACPVHSRDDDYDTGLALLLRERPFVAPARAGVAR